MGCAPCIDWPPLQGRLEATTKRQRQPEEDYLQNNNTCRQAKKSELKNHCAKHIQAAYLLVRCALGFLLEGLVSGTPPTVQPSLQFGVACYRLEDGLSHGVNCYRSAGDSFFAPVEVKSSICRIAAKRATFSHIFASWTIHQPKC